MRRWFLAATAIALFMAPLPASARDPLGVFPVDSLTHSQSSATAVIDSSGNLLVLWGEYVGYDTVKSRLFGGNGEPLGEPLEVGFGGSVAADRDGFTLLSSFSEGAVTQRLDRHGAIVGKYSSLATPDYFEGTVVSDGRSRTLVVGAGYESSLLAYRLDGEARPAGKRFVVSFDGSASGVTMDADGRFIVVGNNRQGEVGQRFAFSGEPLGPQFPVGSREPRDSEAGPWIAGAPDGRFAVVWARSLFDDGQLWIRFFGLDGKPRTPPLQVVNDPYLSFDFEVAAVAMDAAGAVLVAWSTETETGPEIHGRFFDAAGKPAGPVFRILDLLPSEYSYVDALTVVGGQPGKFAAVWELGAWNGIRYHTNVFGRWLPWARSGDDPCLYNAGKLSCDLRHDGGAAEVTYAFGGQPGDVPLLGDLDGDGRDEPCVYRGRRFLCDPARDGGAAELSLLFGSGTAAGDAPLLGDLDGDGRDDPCLRRGDRLLCDTAHDGGTAEVVLTFGHSGAAALLGDVDGDGDDDPCIVESGKLLCDTAHNGGAAERVLEIDLETGDVPLLADLDGDGRDDPCVYRSGRFLCDTAQDGGPAEITLSFGGTGGAPLLGNLDGI